ncbi:MAG: amino acid ABC transporter permease [Actinobacteria bacterium]|nr:amino acid ABC transporter permease [Actinomycetota bacterium]
MSTNTGASIVEPEVPYVDPERRSRRQRRSRRNALVATLSTVVFFGVVVIAVATSPGWPVVQDAFFNGDYFALAWPEVLVALLINIKIFVVAEFFILILGLLLALTRLSKSPALLPLRIVGTLYTDIFRGTPTLLVVLLLGFGVPALNLSGLPTDPLVWGTIALILSYTAYVAEVFRSGIASIHPSQRAAARSLGLSNVQTNRYVVLPQAIRRVIPPLLNDFVSLQKDTALVSVLGPIEALRAAQIIVYGKFNYTPYIVGALLFIALTIPMARFTDWLTARQERQRSSGSR